MIRALCGPGDPATRLENRVGEPAANPYLYAMSQIVAGLDGVEGSHDPGPQCEEPYASDCPCCPGACRRRSTRSKRSHCSARSSATYFIDYFLKLKRNETGRFAR